MSFCPFTQNLTTDVGTVCLFLAPLSQTFLSTPTLAQATKPIFCETPCKMVLRKAVITDFARLSLWELIFPGEYDDGTSLALSGEPLRAQPLLHPEVTALSPFNPQLIKTP
jgi:hypothetical protein